jgi:class 3 adenylate cyclase
MSQKTIVELDLVGYSDRARDLEQQLGVEVVAKFNDQIQEFVNVGLAAISGSREAMVRATTGDGAILVFETASDAHTFAVAVLGATQTHNTQKSAPSAERWFRVGIATGDIYERRRPDGTPEIAGIVIANAIRLESAARPGQIVADFVTFSLLPKNLQVFYGNEEIVEGKRKERFAARRYTVVPFDDQGDSSPTVHSILELFDQLNPRDQLHRLMLQIGMPEEVRPSGELELHRRQDKIVDWSANSSAGLSGLKTRGMHVFPHASSVHIYTVLCARSPY